MSTSPHLFRAMPVVSIRTWYRRRLRWITDMLLCLTVTTGLSAASLHISDVIDLDHDGQNEFIRFEKTGHPALQLLERDSTNRHRVLWEFSAPEQVLGWVTGAKLIDLDQDAIPELVATFVTYSNAAGMGHPWLLIFRWNGSTFGDQPIMVYEEDLEMGRLRPSGFAAFTLADSLYLAVPLAAPTREILIVRLDLAGYKVSVHPVTTLTSELLQNGYGQIHTGVTDSLLVVIGAEDAVLKTAVYNMRNEFSVLITQTLKQEDAGQVFGPDIQAYRPTADAAEHLLLPFKNGNVHALHWVDEDQTLSLGPSPFHQQGFFALPDSSTAKEINRALDARRAAGLLASPSMVSEKPTSPGPELQAPETVTKTDTVERLLPAVPITFDLTESMTLYPDTLTLGDTLTIDVMEEKTGDFYSFKWQELPPEKTDFSPGNGTITWVPQRSQVGMNRFVYEIQLRTGERVERSEDALGDRHQIVPILNADTTDFVVVVRDTVLPPPPPPEPDSLSIPAPPSPVVTEIPSALYGIMVVTPRNTMNERFVFNGVPPFSLIVNELDAVPSEPKPMAHHISANLDKITSDKQVSFSYQKEKELTEDITTITLTHDLETNVLIARISPPLDTIPQSFQPALLDSSLSDFPEYFFDGFPSAVSMDSWRRQLQFPFDDSTRTDGIQTILMLISPTKPYHHLMLSFTGGDLQAIHGEVKVKENGSQKTVTEIDFTGDVRPLLINASLERFRHPAQDPSMLYDAMSATRGQKPDTSASPIAPDSVTSMELPAPMDSVTTTGMDSLQTTTVDSALQGPSTITEEDLKSALEVSLPPVFQIYYKPQRPMIQTIPLQSRSATAFVTPAEDPTIVGEE